MICNNSDNTQIVQDENLWSELLFHDTTDTINVKDKSCATHSDQESIQPNIIPDSEEDPILNKVLDI